MYKNNNLDSVLVQWKVDKSILFLETMGFNYRAIVFNCLRFSALNFRAVSNFLSRSLKTTSSLPSSFTLG